MKQTIALNYIKKDASLLRHPFDYDLINLELVLVKFLESFLELKTIFNKIGVTIVVITTTTTIGPKFTALINPSAAPLLATIKATSPRETIPTPT